MQIDVNKTGSVIKYAGGKTWTVPKIWDIYKKHQDKRFVELFAGGLGASFTMKPNRVLANDTNRPLINFYKNLKMNPAIELDAENTSESYYLVREKFNKLIESRSYNKEMADCFYYLNRCGYNGLYRVNKKGLFNVPYGNYKYSNFKKDLKEHHEIIKNWDFFSLDYKLVEIKEDDFLFLDPPYDTEFTSYSSDGFSFQNQIELVEYFKNHRNPIILMNQATERMVELYKEYNYKIEYAIRPRNFRRDGSSTLEQKREIFATKND